MTNQTYAVYLMRARYDESTDAFAGISYRRVPGLPDFDNDNDALIAADKWSKDNPEAAPEGSECDVCVLDNQGRVRSYARDLDENDPIPF